MKIEFKIIKIVVLLTDGADEVTLHTDAQPTFPPEIDGNPLQLSFKTKKDTAFDYVLRNFGVEPEIINLRREATFKFGA